MHDYVADLDALMVALFPETAINLVGHSMGGHAGSLYAGLRPQRVRNFVSLDAFGPPATRFPIDMYATLTDMLKPKAVRPSRSYASLEDVAARLMKANVRLTADKAAFLADASTARGPDGRWRWLFDPMIGKSLPTLHAIAEWGSIWAHIEARVLWIASGDIRYDSPSFSDEVVAERHRLLPRAEFHRLADTGHNLHHDRPRDVAAMIEGFLG